MTPKFKVGDKVYVKDQDPKGIYVFTVTQVATLYDTARVSKTIVELRDGAGMTAWRTADRLALYVPPKYTIDTADLTYLRARDADSQVISSLLREERGRYGRETTRIRMLHETAASLGYALQDPE